MKGEGDTVLRQRWEEGAQCPEEARRTEEPYSSGEEFREQEKGLHGSPAPCTPYQGAFCTFYTLLPNVPPRSLASCVHVLSASTC